MNNLGGVLQKVDDVLCQIREFVKISKYNEYSNLSDKRELEVTVITYAKFENKSKGDK